MRKIFTIVILVLSINAFTQIPTNGLVGYWPFNGNANDESVNNLNGTVTGAMLTTDRFNNSNSAYNFSSTGQHIDFFSSGSWCSGSHTISFWFNTASSSVKDRNVLTKRSSCMGGSEAPWFEAVIPRNTSNTMHIGWAGGGYGSTFTFSFIPNQWNNVVYVINGTNSSLYVNGALFGSQAYVPTTNAIMLRAGNHSCPVPNDDYIGKFDDLGLWNRALTQNEITGLHNDHICYQSITVTDTLVINAVFTGFNPVRYANTIKIYPNPTKDKITIDCGSNYSTMSGYTIKIMNSLSQTVYTSLVNQQSTTIDLSSWTGGGIYFVHLIDARSNTIDIKKIVLQ